MFTRAEESALTAPVRRARTGFSPLWLAGCLCWPVAAHAGNKVPDWVRAAAATPLPSLPASTKAVVLLDEETYTVAPDGRATEHVRKVVKILRAQGNTLHYTRTYVQRQVVLPADRYDDVQRLEAVIAADEDNQAILKKGN